MIQPVIVDDVRWDAAITWLDGPASTGVDPRMRGEPTRSLRAGIGAPGRVAWLTGIAGALPPETYLFTEPAMRDAPSLGIFRSGAEERSPVLPRPYVHIAEVSHAHIFIGRPLARGRPPSPRP